MAYTLDQQNDVAGDGVWGLRIASGGQDKLAQSYKPSVTAPTDRASLKLDKAGTPTGNIWVTIEADSSGAPSGVALGQSANLDVSTLTGTPTYYDFNITLTQNLTAGTTYWIVLQGDYTRSDTNQARWRTDSSQGYANGTLALYNGSSWSNQAYDQVFKEYYGDAFFTTSFSYSFFM